MKDLLTIKDVRSSKILDLLDLAQQVKSSPDQYKSHLTQKTLALLFQKTSTRTRISFESGMYQLGGEAIYLDWTTTNLHLGSIGDEVKCISLYVDLIVARVYDHILLERMKDATDIPIINGLSDKYHPCQTLSDLMTIRELFPDSFDDIKVAWVGDGNNVCNSLIIGCIKLGIPILIATPKNYEPHQEVLRWVKEQKNCQYMKLENDPKKVVKNADIVYTDTFVSMGQEDEKEKRLKAFEGYQINRALLTHANKNPYIMHCLPAHRGIEITDDVLESERSVVFQQAENRMYLQKALLLKLLGLS